MRDVLCTRIACAAMALIFGAIPARAELPGPIARSASRIAADTAMSPQSSNQQHYRTTCGKKLLIGLAIGAGAGAAYGTGLSVKVGAGSTVVPGMTVLGALVGAAIASHNCQ